METTGTFSVEFTAGHDSLEQLDAAFEELIDQVFMSSTGVTIKMSSLGWSLLDVETVEDSPVLD